jgi:hypothetical protein
MSRHIKPYLQQKLEKDLGCLNTLLFRFLKANIKSGVTHVYKQKLGIFSAIFICPN